MTYADKQPSLTTLILAHKPAGAEQGHQEHPASPSFPESLLAAQCAQFCLNLISHI